MFVGITNTPRDYAWGSSGAISELLGFAASSAPGASGAPEAELWLGAHPGSPSRVVGTDATLDTVIGGRLPFLLKVLAADSPLSLQAHPNPEQAAAGFARENAAGIALDAPERNYRDPFAKPELLFALSEEFHVLCGFRRTSDIRSLLLTLDAGAGLVGLLERLNIGGVRGAFEWLIARSDGVHEVISAVTSAAAHHAAPEFATAAALAAAYPGDPGIVISLLMNRLTLARGECIYLPAGNIHAYLSGVGIELMTASDNVLRGGLTPKHVDVAELIEVLDFAPMDSALLAPVDVSPTVRFFRPPVHDFQLAVATGAGEVVLGGQGIALCVSGEFTISGALGSVHLTRGEAMYASADERSLRIAGGGQLFIATGQ